MSRLRHLAIAAADPLRVVELLETAFGCTRLRWDPANEFAMVTDGYLHITITKAGPAASPGLDHLGFQVDDLPSTTAMLRGAGLAETSDSQPLAAFYDGPDGWGLEVRERGWERIIAAHTELLDVVPAPRTQPRVTQVHGDAIDEGPPCSVRVGHIDELPPGSAARVEVANRAVLVVNVDGEFLAVQDECPHQPRYGRLSEGWRDGVVVECPHHMSRFDLRTGACLAPPATRDLCTFPTHVRDDTVWLDAPA